VISFRLEALRLIFNQPLWFGLKERGDLRNYGPALVKLLQDLLGSANGMRQGSFQFSRLLQLRSGGNIDELIWDSEAVDQGT
jgi:hypothetical protein